MTEDDQRLDWLQVMFAAWEDKTPTAKVNVYYRLTRDIPFHWFEVAIIGVMKSHEWGKAPSIAAIHLAAKFAAGMHRQRYRAGFYLPPATDWPPEGKRYAIEAGVFERAAPVAIGPGEVALLLGSGEQG